MYCIQFKEIDAEGKIDETGLFAVYGPFSSEGQAKEWLGTQCTDGLKSYTVLLWHPLTPIAV